MPAKKTKEEEIKDTEFPISSKRIIKSSRHIAREKVLQILVAYFVSGTSINELIKHIFTRDYNFEGDVIEQKDEKHSLYNTRALSQEEIYELDADAAIKWREEDIDFARVLINEAINEQEFIIEQLKKISINWEYDRISIIDRILIIMAVTEFMHCPEIPVKVSINEVMNISKIYSTEKSTQFINGILDKFLVYLKEQNKINKTGRGLD